MKWRVTVALGLWLVIICCFALAKAPSSYLDLRYTNVIEQSNEYTCGAAAVATLLTYFYGIPVTEQDVLSLVYSSMRTRGEKPEQGRGLTAYDLKEALEAEGVETKGFLMKFGPLQEEIRTVWFLGNFPQENSKDKSKSLTQV